MRTVAPRLALRRLPPPLRSRYRGAESIARYLREKAEACLADLEQSAEEALLLWGQSVLEKPGSTAAHGLCPVRSGKAARLKKIRPGYSHPPGRPPAFVPGAIVFLFLSIRTLPQPRSPG